MEYEVNAETVSSLLKIYRDDAEMAGVILDALDSFEEYHQAIWRLEMRRLLYACGGMDADTYREEIPALDSVRTRRHNNLLAQVGLLNRLAEKEGLPPFYPGPVSEERPIRTHVADAVLAYVRSVIADRITGGR